MSKTKKPLKALRTGKFCVLSIALDDPVMSNRCLDLALPEKAGNPEEFAFFFVHGGGWGAGSRGQYYPVMQYVCDRGFTAAATGYRLCKYSPVTAFDQLLDIRQSYMLLVKYLQQTTGKRHPKIVVMGSSAGAHLGSLLAYAAPGQCGEPLQYQGMPLAADEWVVDHGLRHGANDAVAKHRAGNLERYAARGRQGLCPGDGAFISTAEPD